MTRHAPTDSSATSSKPASFIERIGIPRPLLWGFVGLLIFMIGDGVELGYLSPYLQSEGLTEANVGLLFTLYGVTVALSSWLAGALSNLWGPRMVMWLGLIIWSVLEVAFLTLALGRMNFPMMLLTYTLRGFGYPLFAYGFLVWIAAATPSRRLGMAVSWFWVAYATGLPTLGSLVASITIPMIGTLDTLWLSFGLVIVGGLIALLGLRHAPGAGRLSAPGIDPMKALASNITILWREPKAAKGGIVRTINTASQYGFLVTMPTFFMHTVGFTLTQWLQLLTLMFMANIAGNFLSGPIGGRMGLRNTVIWMGAVGCAITTPLFFYVPQLFPGNFAVAAMVGVLYGFTLAGFVPLSALMPILLPKDKAGALSVLSLGAGASTWVGPAIAAIFVGVVGLGGVVWIFSGLYVLSALMMRGLREPSLDVEGDGAAAPELTRQGRTPRLTTAPSIAR